MPYTPVTPEVIAQARSKGITLPPTAVMDENNRVWASPPPDAGPVASAVENPPEPSGVQPSIGRAVYTGAVKSAIPLATGVGVGNFIGAGIGALGGNPLTVYGGSLLGGALAGYLTSRGQEKVLNKIAEGNPQGDIARLQKASEEESTANPYWQMAGGQIPGFFAGGIPNIRNLKTSIPARAVQAAQVGTVQGGLDIAQQMASGQPFDPAQFGISVLGGAAAGGVTPHVASSALPKKPVARRAVLQSRLTELQGGPQPPEGGPEPSGSPVIPPEVLVNTSPEGLRSIVKGNNSAMGEAVRQAAYIKEELAKANLPFEANYAEQLLASNNPKEVATAIKAQIIPKVEEVQKAAAEKAAAQEEATKANINAGTVRSLAENPPEARITEVRPKEGGGVEITQPPTLPSTIESAKVLAGTEYPSMDKAMKDFTSRDAKIKSYEAKLADYGEGTPERELLTNTLAQMRKDLNADVIKFLESRKAPEAPAGVTTEEAARPRVIGKIEPPKETPPAAPSGGTPPETPPSPTTPKLVQEVAKGKATFEDLLGRNVGGEPTPGPVAPETPPTEPSSGPSTSGILTKVFGRVVPEAFSNRAYVTLAIDRTTPGGIKEADVRNSLPESLRSKITRVEGFRGSGEPTTGKPVIGSAKIRITFDSLESAQAAHDYLSGKPSAAPALPEPTPAEKLGVAAQPGQQPKEISLIDRFKNALGLMTSDREGQRARNLLQSHPAMKGVKVQSVDDLRNEFSKLLPGDQQRLADLYDAKAENYVAKSGVLKYPKPTTEAPISKEFAANVDKYVGQILGGKSKEDVLKPLGSKMRKYVEKALAETSPDAKELLTKQAELKKSQPVKEGAPAKESLPPNEPLYTTKRGGGKFIGKWLIDGIGASSNDDVFTSKAEADAVARRLSNAGIPKEQAAKARASGGIEAVKKLLSSEESRNFGIGEVANKANPVEMLRAAVKPTTAQVAENYGDLGKTFAKRVESLDIHRDQLEQPKQQFVKELGKGVDEASAERIQQYGQEMYENNKSSIKLTPKEQEVYDGLRLLADETAKEKSGPNAPWINAIENGRHVVRPFQKQQRYWPSVRSAEVDKLVNDPKSDPARAAQLRKDFIDWVMKKTGASEEAANKIYAAQLHEKVGNQGPNPEFRGSRLESGIGLPPSWREPNALVAMRKYLNRHYTDLVYHQDIESNPALAKGLALSDMGKGDAIPEKVMHNGEEVQLGQIANKDTAAALRAYTGATDPGAQKFEKWLGFIHTLKLGPVTQTKNHIQTVGMLPGVIHPSEYPLVLKAWHDMFTPEGYARALQSGSVRAGRNITPGVAMDIDTGMTKIMDIANKYTGTEALAKANDVFLDTVGRGVAENRIALGDKDFLEKFGPPDWRTKSLDEIVNYAAARFTKNFAGAFNATEQPSYMLRGTGGPFSVLYKLSRWPIGRFNRWYENEYTQLKNGNPLPVISQLAGGMLSAGAVNYLVQALTNRKPKEMTWEEFLNTGGKDKAYTIFSKIATASQTGLLGDLLFAGTQYMHGEYPRGYNNLLLKTASDTITRLNQFATAVSDGTTSFWGGLPTLAFSLMKDQIQVAKLLDEQDDTGSREERIARRIGYLPPKGEFAAPGLDNPFSEAGAYRREDIPALTAALENKIKMGVSPSAPDSEVRNQRVYYQGEPKGYYDFIAEAQGQKAADAARERDYENTIKKRQMYSSALANRK